VTDSLSPLLLRPPQRVENESPPKCRDLLGGRNKWFRPKNTGSMTVRLCELGPWAYRIHLQKSVRLGLCKGP